MEIKIFDILRLQEVKDVLRDAFFRPDKDEKFNEWEFAEKVLDSKGYIPELCLVAFEDGEAVGYSILTVAVIGEKKGLALGPLGVKREYQNKGIGTCLVEESIKRAKIAGYPWIALTGGDYYSRFGFEKGQAFHIVVSEDEFENAHIQILFLLENARNGISGKLMYCDAFYDEKGNLL